MSVRILTGDALTMLATLEVGSVAACVSDPPYGLKFMGRAWDHGVPGVPYWEAVHRVLAPGAWLLAFGGTRTYHRLTCAIEDAGFEIRDCLSWMYGSGFPKGKGCLKPGWEPIVLARKREPRPVLQIDACRLDATGNISFTREACDRSREQYRTGGAVAGTRHESGIGRWPANVVLSHEPECREVGTKRVRASSGGLSTNALGRMNDDAWIAQPRETIHYTEGDGKETVPAFECVESCPVRMLDEQSGERPTGTNKAGGKKFGRSAYAHDAYSLSMERTAGGYGDTGGASRFFYCSKASTAERGRGNDHPTVKPLALMSWLVKLVTPPGGTVIDPFCGSGTNLIAADRLGFDCIGIDSDPHTIEIAQSRCLNDAGMLAEVRVS